jgi:hypothetical protein
MKANMDVFISAGNSNWWKIIKGNHFTKASKTVNDSFDGSAAGASQVQHPLSTSISESVLILILTISLFP